jgi:hypothetical protein
MALMEVSLALAGPVALTGVALIEAGLLMGKERWTNCGAAEAGVWTRR